MTSKEILFSSFNNLSLPEDCSAWLIALWDCIQTLDDYADGDKVEREDLDALIWNVLFGMPSNTWFMQNAGHILPVVGSAILKWKGSDTAEKEGGANERSFCWRAGYYDVVLQCVMLTHGHKAAMSVSHVVMNMYGESFKDYAKEFNEVKNA